MDFSKLSRSTQAILKKNGVISPESLFNMNVLQLNIPTQTLNEMKKECISVYNIPISMKTHSWYGLQCHVRDGSFLRRGIITKLSLTRIGVSVEVHTQGKVIKTTPLLLICMHFLWLRNMILSDDDTDDEDETFDTLPPLQIFSSNSIYLLDMHAIKLIHETVYNVNSFMTVLTPRMSPFSL